MGPAAPRRAAARGGTALSLDRAAVVGAATAGGPGRKTVGSPAGSLSDQGGFHGQAQEMAEGLARGDVDRRGILMGATLVTPSVAHVASWAHNWKEHIKPRADKRYYTKARAKSLSGRVAQNNTEQTALNNGSDNQFVSELSVNMSSGAERGFVLVQANLAAWAVSEANCPCQVEMRIMDMTADVAGNRSFAWVGGTADEDGLGMGSGSVSAVFQMPARSTHQFDFQAVVDDSNGSVNGRIDMWAQFIPFNGTGGKTLSVARAASGADANP